MEKFIPYEKLSKKEKRKLDQAKRQTWGKLNPATRKPTSSRAYNRRKAQNWKKELPGSALCVSGGNEMTNYEAIIKMAPGRMERFLDQVYLAGLNNGMYAARQKDDTILDRNPFSADWLSVPAEAATAPGSDEEDEEYLLSALVEAIFRNAGIDP